jgi:hypothetical protein
VGDTSDNLREDEERAIKAMYFVRIRDVCQKRPHNTPLLSSGAFFDAPLRVLLRQYWGRENAQGFKLT